MQGSLGIASCPPPGMIKVGVPPHPIFGSPTCWQDLGLELETRCLPSGVQRDLDSFMATASSRPPSFPHVAPQAEGKGHVHLPVPVFLTEEQGPRLWPEEDGSDSTGPTVTALRPLSSLICKVGLQCPPHRWLEGFNERVQLPVPGVRVLPPIPWVCLPGPSTCPCVRG